MTILQQATIVQKHETINTVKLYVYIKRRLIHMHDQRQGSQLAFTCTKLTTEVQEKGMNYVDHVVLVFLLLTLNIFHTFFQYF